MSRARELHLVDERKLRDLLPKAHRKKRLEASGILALDSYFVVFDGRSEIARIDPDWDRVDRNAMLGPQLDDVGYEGIAWNATAERIYLLIEARRSGKHAYRAEIVEYDREFRLVGRRPMDFTFETENTGFESIVY